MLLTVNNLSKNMAVYRNGPNSGLSGKFGSVIGYRLNGQDIIKGWPKKRQSKPSVKELANREKFALLQVWLQPILHFLRIGFKNYAPTFQGFVAAKSYNSKHAMYQNEAGNWFVEPASVLVSYGTLPLPHLMEMKVIDDKIEITWSKETGERGLDGAMILTYNLKTKWVTGDFTVSRRDTGKATIDRPSDTGLDEIHVYLAFVAYDQTNQSKSHYLGAI
jgi:hypothetical protein